MRRYCFFIVVIIFVLCVRLLLVLASVQRDESLCCTNSFVDGRAGWYLFSFSQFREEAAGSLFRLSRINNKTPGLYCAKEK